MKPDTFCMLLHFSSLLFFFPPFGIVAPIVLWAVGKDKSPQIDAHGKLVINWCISSLIYAFVFGLLCWFIVGFFLLPVLMLLMIIFLIIGGVKANDGILWKYPLSIPFFK